MLEQLQHHDRSEKMPHRRIYIRRGPKKKEVVEETKKNLTAADLAASEGLTLEQYKERLSNKNNEQIEELRQQIQQEEIAKRDIEKNITDAYAMLDYLHSPERQDAGLMQLDPERFRKMRADLDRLLRESAEPESGKVFLVARIAALDAAVEVLYELYEKENLNAQRSKPGVLGALGLLSKEKIQRAKYTKEVLDWANETRRDVRGMIQQLLRRPRVLNPKEREILERLQLQLDDLVVGRKV